jgi:colanic acid biosynthesis glycosyl transferase WcaI
MRFLILTQYFPPEVGAAQVRLFSIAKDLRRRGHEVTVVTALPNYPTGIIPAQYRNRWRVEEEIEGIPVTRMWLYPATGRNIGKRLLSYWSFTISAVFGCLSGPRPDVLLVESPPLFLGLSGLLGARLRGARAILNVSDLWPASARELGIITNPTLLWLSSRLEGFLYSAYDWVSAVTPGIRDAVLAVNPDAHLLFLPNGVDTDFFHRVAIDSVEQGFEPGKSVFVYAGTHGYVSAIDVILEAAGLLRDEPTISFVLVGDGSDKPRLEAMAREKQLGNVRFLPSRPVGEMPALFSASRASLVPLRSGEFFRRTLPAKMFPSLACATPVIHCGDGDAAALIKETGCGLVVKPDSPTELAEAVRTLAGDPGLARSLGDRGRQLVEERFGWRSSLDSWLETLGTR